MILDVLLTTEDGFVLTAEDESDLFVGSIEISEDQRYGGGGKRDSNQDELIESVLDLAEIRAKNAKQAAQIAAKTIGKAAQISANSLPIGKIELDLDNSGQANISKNSAQKRLEEDAFVLSILMMFDD